MAVQTAGVFSQTPGTAGGASSGIRTGTEIQDIEKNLEKTGLSGAERRGLLIRLAQIQELAGNIEAAAQNWTAAAAAEPGKQDNLSVIKGAYCLAAMGEWDRAEAAVNMVLRAGQAGPALLLARYAGAYIEAFSSGNVSPLRDLASDPGFAAMRPAVYYTLWKVTGADQWKDRLLAEFPRSPEGRIAADAGGIVSAAPAAMWLFFPGRGEISPAAPDRPPVPVPQTPAASASTPVPPAAPDQPPAPVSQAPGTGVLQTGLFGNEANARRQADRLQAAGFTPALSRRRVNGADYWAVSVPPGQDMSRTILRLKDAGFESFPVF
jgi:hypothetical protein